MYKAIFLTITILSSLFSIHAQNKYSISGKISDENAEALIGAHVYLNGTSIGVATNEVGEFKIKNVIPKDYQLCVSYSGYKRYRQPIELNQDISGLDITMNQAEGNLGEVVVTGSGTPHHLKTAPVPTELISKKTIEDVAAPDFISLMQTVSPSFDFSPGSMGSFIQLNGLGNDFIVILIDGKRVYGDMGGLNDLGRISPDNVERIEVVKGASSLLYGSDAIAGVINIITKKSKRKFSLTNNTLLSEFNGLQQTANIDFNSRKLKSHTSFSLKKTDGWQNSPYEMDGEDLVETDYMTQNPYNNRNISQDLAFYINDQFTLSGGASYYINDIQNPAKSYGYYFEDLSYHLGAQYLVSDKSKVDFIFTSDRYKYYYKYNEEYKSYEKGDFTLNNDQQRMAYDLKWITKLNDYHTLTVGEELINEIYRSETRVEGGKAEAFTHSFYAQDEIKMFTHLMATAGFRVVSHQNFGSIVTPKLSLLYKLNSFNLRGTYSNGFKAPTLKELYYQYEKRGTVYMGNTDLDPQKSHYYSLGVDYNNDWFSGNISAYNNDVNGLIVYKTIDLLPGDEEAGITSRRQHYNVEDAQTLGADIMFDVKLPKGFTVGGGYSYVDARNLTSDNRLEYVAQNYLNVRAGYAHKWNEYSLRVNVLGRLQDERYFEGEPNAKAYQLWKLSTVHDFAEFNSFKIRFTAGIDNVLDEVDDSPYGSHYGTINPGRTFFAGLEINFSK